MEDSWKYGCGGIQRNIFLFPPIHFTEKNISRYFHEFVADSCVTVIIYKAEFENGGFTLKAHQMCSFHTRPEKFKNGDFTLKTHRMLHPNQVNALGCSKARSYQHVVVKWIGTLRNDDVSEVDVAGSPSGAVDVLIAGVAIRGTYARRQHIVSILAPFGKWKTRENGPYIQSKETYGQTRGLSNLDMKIWIWKPKKHIAGG